MIGAPRRRAIKSFAHLWRTEDGAWMEERKNIWHGIQNTCFIKSEKEDIDRYRDYFLTSKYTRYIGIRTLYFLTPILTQEDSQLFLKSGVLEKRDYRTLVDSYLWSYFFENSDGSPWIRKQVHRFYDHVITLHLSRSPNETELAPAPDINPASLAPEDFVLSYFDSTARLFRNPGDYSAFTDLHAHFMHGLEGSKVLTQHHSEAQDYFEEVFDACEIVLSKDSFGVEAKRHAAQLLEDRQRILSIWDRAQQKNQA